MHKKPISVSKPTSGDTPGEIFLYGTIGYEVSAGEFAIALKELEKVCKTIYIHVNSVGGCVFDGIAIYNLISNCKAKIEFFVDGIAASMASAMMAGVAKVRISKYGRMMIHRPQTWSNGDIDTLQRAVKELKAWEGTLIDLYSGRTGKEKSWIKDNYFKPGVDSWFSAEEAVAAGLADDIFDGIMVEPSEVENSSVQDVWSHYNKIINQSIEQMKDKMRFIALLATIGIVVAADADPEDQIYAEFKKHLELAKSLKQDNVTLSQQINDLKEQISSGEKAKIKTVLDGAVASKKITEAERPAWQSLLEKDFANASASLEKIAPVKSITSQLSPDGGEKEDDRKDWKFSDYQQKDPSALAEFKSKNPEKFKQLYRAQYGKDPIL